MELDVKELIDMSEEDLFKFIKKQSRNAKKREIWNLIAEEDVSKIRKLSDYMKTLKVTKIHTEGKNKGKIEITTEFNKLMTSIRSDAVKAAWNRERKLVSEGKGTVNWTVDQQKIILASKNNSYVDFGEDSLNYQGHHMCSVVEYPELAGLSDNIQFLQGYAQTKGSEHNLAHRGASHNPSDYFYDTITNGKLEFSEKNVKGVSIQVIDLTNIIGGNGEKIPNPALDRFKDLFPDINSN